jgi:hypothetical protein
VLDKIQPGIVEWKKVKRNPKNPYEQAENTNYCVDLGKQLRFSMVGIAGKDFLDGNSKLILGDNIYSKFAKFGSHGLANDEITCVLDSW